MDSVLPLSATSSSLKSDGLLSSSTSPLFTTATGPVGSITGSLSGDSLSQTTSSSSASSLDSMGASSKTGSDVPLDLQEVKGVTEGAFKDAYDYYKENAVGDPKTRAQYLGVLRNELAEYEEGEDGKRDLTKGILKNFTDDNYKNALSQGENLLSGILGKLSETKFTSFASFREAREKAETDLHSQLQNSVAYPELSEKFVKGLEDLSTKVGLEFNLSDAEKEKEQLEMSERRNNLEMQKKTSDLASAFMASTQIQSNLETEKKILTDQHDKLSREWKQRIDFDSKARMDQITHDLQNGFEDRAKNLQSELAVSNQQAMAMMMQMHKESKESQDKLTQALLENRRQQEAEQQALQQQPRPQGLLSNIIGSVVGLLGNLLGAAPQQGGGGLL